MELVRIARSVERERKGPRINSRFYGHTVDVLPREKYAKSEGRADTPRLQKGTFSHDFLAKIAGACLSLARAYNVRLYSQICPGRSTVTYKLALATEIQAMTATPENR
jgi:hypothetical protein